MRLVHPHCRRILRWRLHSDCHIPHPLAKQAGHARQLGCCLSAAVHGAPQRKDAVSQPMGAPRQQQLTPSAPKSRRLPGRRARPPMFRHVRAPPLRRARRRQQPGSAGRSLGPEVPAGFGHNTPSYSALRPRQSCVRAPVVAWPGDAENRLRLVACAHSILSDPSRQLCHSL